MMTRKWVLACAIYSVFSGVGVMAAENAPISATPDAVVAGNTTKEQDTPVTRLQQATDKLAASLEGNKLQQFAAIENSYRTIRAVEDVQSSVGRAITSCGKANPTEQRGYNETYAAWRDAIRPMVAKGRDKLDKMVLLQNFAQPSEVRTYLKQLEAAVVYRNQGIKAIPVGDKKDCDKLVANMAETQDNLIKLLNENLKLDQPLQTQTGE